MEREEFSPLALSQCRYNNETYRILDIAWNKDPSLSFAKRDGTEQSLSQYCQQVNGDQSFIHARFVLLDRNITLPSKMSNSH
jgi:hypothetical protein